MCLPYTSCTMNSDRFPVLKVPYCFSVMSLGKLSSFGNVYRVKFSGSRDLTEISVSASRQTFC